MSELKLNNSNFQDEILNRKGLALVDFYADWCGPCKMVAPVIHEIAEERKDIAVGKINVDESYELAAKYNVVSIPTIILFNNGAEINRIVGYRPKSDILGILEQN